MKEVILLVQDGLDEFERPFRICLNTGLRLRVCGAQSDWFKVWCIVDLGSLGQQQGVFEGWAILLVPKHIDEFDMINEVCLRHWLEGEAWFWAEFTFGA